MQLHEVWVEQGPGQCPADACEVAVVGVDAVARGLG
jgi:hypothetical protein